MSDGANIARAAVADDGCRIALTTYAGPVQLAEVELDPLAAVALGNQLVSAGLRHLSRGTLGPSRRPRGKRTPETALGLLNGNRAILRLRNEYFGNFEITKAAHQIATEGRRYEAARWRVDRQKPTAEISNERARLYAEVLHGREHFPGPRRVRGIVWEMNSSPIHFPNSGAGGEYDDLNQ